MDENDLLEEIKFLYRQHKKNCERAAVQASNDDFFTTFGQNPDSVAVIMKHFGGNNSPVACVIQSIL